MNKSAVNNWIFDHSTFLCSLFASLYIAAVVLIPLGLTRGYLPLIYFGEVCAAILLVLLGVAARLDRWLVPVSPLSVQTKVKVVFLEINNYTARVGWLIPAIFLVAFLVVAFSGIPDLYVIAVGGYFELAYLIFVPAWRYYVERFVGMSFLTGASSFASLAQLFLSRFQGVGLDYFRRAIHDYQQHLLINEMTNNALIALDTIILAFKANVMNIPFRTLARLANLLSKLPHYERFGEDLSRFQSRYSWVRNFDHAPRHPGWAGRNATVTLTLLGLIFALTVTESIKNYISTVLTEATTGGLSQLIFALVVYLGTIVVVSKAGALYASRIPRGHISEFRKSS